jgi:polypeptide N-acetylgalactosaminyltransferase
MRSGNGEQGRPFHLSADLEAEKQSLYRSNGFNALASDHIALNRSIPDIRNRACHSKLFAAKLPRASVIIPFYNEHLSTLLRSVYSILNRSPHELLEEIILADDLSDKSFLGSELDDYIAKHWPDGRVKVVRTKERQGLIRARLMGARVAKSQVFGAKL